MVERLARPGTVEKLLHRDDTADVAALRVEQVAMGARKDKLAVLFADGRSTRPVGDREQADGRESRRDRGHVGEGGVAFPVGAVGRRRHSRRCGRRCR